MKKYLLYKKNPQTQSLFVIDNCFTSKTKMYARISELLVAGNDVKIEQDL